MQDHSDEFEQEESESRNPVRERMRQLEDEVKTLRTQAQEAEHAKKELAFIKVGIDLETPTGKLFAKAYDGDSTPEAISAAAAEYGIIKGASPVVADANEQAAWSSTAASHTTGSISAGGDVDLVAKIRGASSPQELEALMNAARASLQG